MEIIANFLHVYIASALTHISTSLKKYCYFSWTFFHWWLTHKGVGGGDEADVIKTPSGTPRHKDIDNH